MALAIETGILTGTNLRVAERIAEELRGKARKRLDELLDSEDERIRLRAGAAIASYSPQRPPVEGAGLELERRPRKIVVLSDLLRVAAECGFVTAADGGPVLVNGERVERTPRP